MSQIIDKLTQFGLSEKEACVYSCLTAMGTSVVSAVAKRAELNRSTTYVILESLSKQGLVGISKRGKIQVFTPMSPSKLVQIAQENADRYENLVEIGKELITELQLDDKTQSQKPNIQIFQGVEGIKNIFDDVINSRQKNIFVYKKPEGAVTDDKFLISLRDFYKNIERKSEVTSLSDNTVENRKIMTENESGLTNHYLIKTEANFNSDLILYGDKIAFISRTEKLAYIIQNNDFATGFKNLLVTSKSGGIRWNIKSESAETKSRTKQPALVKAEKRFWKI